MSEQALKANDSLITTEEVEEVIAAKKDPTRVIVIGLLVVLALVLIVITAMIIIALFRGDLGLDALLPFLNSDNSRELDFR